MAARGGRKVMGPKRYDPNLARVSSSAAGPDTSRLKAELGLDELSGSDHSGSEDEFKGRNGGGADLHEELEESTQQLNALKAELQAVQQSRDELRSQCDAELADKDKKMRAAGIRHTALLKQRDTLIQKMLDAVHELEAFRRKHDNAYSDDLEAEFEEERDRAIGPISSTGGSGGDPGATAALEAENAMLRKKVKSLTEELDSVSAESKKAPAVDRSAEKAASAAAEAAQQQQVTQLQDQIQQLQKKLSVQQQEVNAASRRAEAAEDRLKTAEANAEKLRARAEQAVKEAAAASASAAAADPTESSGSIQDNKPTGVSSAELDELRSQLESERKARAAADSQQEEFIAALTKLKEKYSKCKADLKAAQDDLASANTKVEELQAAKDAASSRAAELQNAKDAAVAEVSAVKSSSESSAAEISSQVAEARAAAAEAKSAAAEANEQSAKLAEKYAKAKEDRQLLKSRVLEQDAALQQHEAEIAQLTQQIADLNKAKEEAVAAAESTNKHMAAQLSEEQSRLQTQLAAMEADLKRTQSQLSEELTGRRKAEQEAKDQAGQVQQAQQMLQEYEQQHDAIMAQVQAKYTKKMDKLKAKFASSATVLQANDTLRSDLKQSLVALKTTVASSFEDLNSTLVRRIADLSEASNQNQQAFNVVVDRYETETKARRKLFNQLQELRGNIRVFARVRPIVPMEAKNGEEVAVDIGEGELTIGSKGVRKRFEFDHVFPFGADNVDVFSKTEDLLTSVMDGYNVCIFAYGQTGSGKTFTMEGPPENPGLNFRTLKLLFELRDARSRDWDFQISVSLLEIYLEDIIDLLGSANPESKLAVKMNTDGTLYVPGLTQRPVNACEEVLDIMREGYRNRSSFATDMNEHSSRSHCILSVTAMGRNRFTDATSVGKLHLIDLAGSERLKKSGATGKRQEEAIFINKSLSALADVIAARAAKKDHVPYRNSTLTYLLQDSLSKNSKTLMFVNLSPVGSNAEESVCSLQFASRVRTVELGPVTKNVKK